MLLSNYYISCYIISLLLSYLFICSYYYLATKLITVKYVFVGKTIIFVLYSDKLIVLIIVNSLCKFHSIATINLYQT